MEEIEATSDIAETDCNKAVVVDLTNDDATILKNDEKATRNITEITERDKSVVVDLTIDDSAILKNDEKGKI